MAAPTPMPADAPTLRPPLPLSLLPVLLVSVVDVGDDAELAAAVVDDEELLVVYLHGN